MREAVDRARLEAFLTQLGRSYRHPARLYLSGGESLVWRGVRGTTRDIDVTYDVDSIALSKLVRWHARDRADVRALLTSGAVTAERLREVVAEVLPAFAARAVRNDPERLRRNLESALSPD